MCTNGRALGTIRPQLGKRAHSPGPVGVSLPSATRPSGSRRSSQRTRSGWHVRIQERPQVATPQEPVPQGATVTPGAPPSPSPFRASGAAPNEPVPNSFSFDKPRDPQWFKHAVFYEVLVRGFHDSNGDGTGDLPGLIGRLDYLEWLGVDCIWLLPIYASPLRDGGYDIADYLTVLPEYGTIGDFVELVEAAHARGIRIIADLVMNHTSDAHPWFQSSRADPTGPHGDWYVWSDTDERYSDARVIFVDTEKSNWTWDPVRGQYYWHRFFSHQPDLNYENPAVQEVMLEMLRYWLDLGIDGFRLDAVP